jgi:exodeoxyribonuclease VII small subunit
MNISVSRTFNLEKALEELERIVVHMEKDILGIESTLIEFEKGVKLIRECQQALQHAEQKVRILTEKNGEFALTDYLADESSE